MKLFWSMSISFFISQLQIGRKCLKSDVIGFTEVKDRSSHKEKTQRERGRERERDRERERE